MYNIYKVLIKGRHENVAGEGVEGGYTFFVNMFTLFTDYFAIT